MSDLRAILTVKAMSVIPGQAYNAFREQHQAGDPSREVALYFEDALPADGTEQVVVGRVVPSLMRFLKRKKQSTDKPRNVLVALFLGESCFVLAADVLLDIYCELEGVDRQALRARVLAWMDG
jgi:hypothetical protein